MNIYLQQQIGAEWSTLESDTLIMQEEEDHAMLMSGPSGGNDNPSLTVIWELPHEHPVFRLNITTNSPEPVPLGLRIIQHANIYRYKVCTHKSAWR